MSREMPKSLSPSSISSFKECPLAYRFSYLDRLPEPPSPAASKGTLVHRALELMMCRPPTDRTVDAALADLDFARIELADDPEFADLDLTDEQRSQFHADAEQLVRRYFELEDPTTVHPIGLELKLQADLQRGDLGTVRIRGIIDRLELDADGELVVTDYKTGRVPSEFFESKSLGGVHIYALLCEEMLGRRPARVQLLYLSKPEAIIATPTEQSVRGVARKSTALWTAIESACARDSFQARPSRLCDFCSFKPYCPAHGGDPEQAVELRDEPVQLEPTLDVCAPDTVIEPALPLASA
jgi:putative RecB family exonuclease